MSISEIFRPRRPGYLRRMQKKICDALEDSAREFDYRAFLITGNRLPERQITEAALGFVKPMIQTAAGFCGHDVEWDQPSIRLYEEDYDTFGGSLMGTNLTTASQSVIGVTLRNRETAEAIKFRIVVTNDAAESSISFLTRYDAEIPGTECRAEYCLDYALKHQLFGDRSSCLGSMVVAYCLNEDELRALEATWIETPAGPQPA